MDKYTVHAGVDPSVPVPMTAVKRSARKGGVIVIED